MLSKRQTKTKIIIDLNDVEEVSGSIIQDYKELNNKHALADFKDIICKACIFKI